MMRVAIAGKGGSGKTTISGTVARLLSRRGRRVVAIDGDTNPNLAETLGVQDNGNGGIAALPSDLLVRREDPEGNPYTELAVPVEEVIARYGIPAPDGVQLLVMGQIDHAGKGCKCRAHAIARNLIGDLLQYNVGAAGDVVVDMEAGLEHLSRGTTKHVDALLAVAEPYYRSLETARRACELATELGIGRVGVVANKVRDEQEDEAIRAYVERHGLRLVGKIPFDEAVMQADRTAGGLLDVGGSDAPAVRALSELADSLVAAGAESHPG
jgi:CO dehydrogenase maturation factor